MSSKEKVAVDTYKRVIEYKWIIAFIVLLIIGVVLSATGWFRLLSGLLAIIIAAMFLQHGIQYVRKTDDTLKAAKEAAAAADVKGPMIPPLYLKSKVEEAREFIKRNEEATEFIKKNQEALAAANQVINNLEANTKTFNENIPAGTSTTAQTARRG